MSGNLEQARKITEYLQKKTMHYSEHLILILLVYKWVCFLDFPLNQLYSLNNGLNEIFDMCWFYISVRVMILPFKHFTLSVLSYPVLITNM